MSYLDLPNIDYRLHIPIALSTPSIARRDCKSSLSRASSLNRGCEPFYLSPKLFNLKCFVRLGSGTVHEGELFLS